MDKTNCLTPSRMRTRGNKTNCLTPSRMRMQGNESVRFHVCTSYYISAADLKLTSSVDEGRQFMCPEERVTFTCQVFRSFLLDWQSPPDISVAYTANHPLGDIVTRSSFEANLTLVSRGQPLNNSNISSTLMITEPRDTVSVQCLNTARDSEMANFTTTGNIYKIRHMYNLAKAFRHTTHVAFLTLDLLSRDLSSIVVRVSD